MQSNFILAGIKITFSICYIPTIVYYGILKVADDVGDISVLITNAILLHHSFSLLVRHCDQELR